MAEQKTGSGKTLAELEAEYAKLVGLQAEHAKLKRENEQLRSAVASRVSLRVSEKGAMSVYGLQRWPVTLYREQWLKLFSIREQIEQFLNDNVDKLTTKPAGI